MDKDREEAPLLIGQAGPLKGQRWVLKKPILVGREVTCEVVIPDRMVSRFHARLTPTVGGVVLEDLDSKNGTHCNGAAVKGPVVLQDGDLVSIALAQQFIYLTSDATTPLVEASKAPGRLKLDMRSRSVLVQTNQSTPRYPPCSSGSFKCCSNIRVRSSIAASWSPKPGARRRRSAFPTRPWTPSCGGCGTASPPSTPPTITSSPSAGMAFVSITLRPNRDHQGTAPVHLVQTGAVLVYAIFFFIEYFRIAL